MQKMNYVIQYLSWKKTERENNCQELKYKNRTEGSRDVSTVGRHIFLLVGQIMPNSFFFSLLNENFVKNKSVFNLLN